MPNRLVEHVLAHEPVPVGFWRSVGHSYNAFFAEGFLDECAHAAGKDPLEYRLSMLARRRATARCSRRRRRRRIGASRWPRAAARAPARHRAGGKLPFHRRAGRRSRDRRTAPFRVRRIVCAIDCGFAVNPAIVAAQMESGIIFGLSAALYGEITLKDGRVEQSNYHDYEVVRMADCPRHRRQDRRQRLGPPGRRGRTRHAAHRARRGQRRFRRDRKAGSPAADPGRLGRFGGYFLRPKRPVSLALPIALPFTM